MSMPRLTLLIPLMASLIAWQQSGDWSAMRYELRDGPEAELLVRVGDIDNLGFGFRDGFDPFSGETTPVHRFPWEPGDADPDGTDRIMVPSSFDPDRQPRRDGYTRSTSRPDNTPRPVVIELDLADTEVEAAQLQLFVDDFQAPVFGTVYEVSLDGTRMPTIEAVVNELQQTGPRGKLVTVAILDEHLALLNDGRLEVLIDDTTTGAGDGFALDFVRLLVNPRAGDRSGTIRGRVVDAASNEPLQGVLVTAGGGVVEIETAADGSFVLEGVPAGLQVVRASAPGYQADSGTTDLVAGGSVDLQLRLQPAAETGESLAAALADSGRVAVRGIYFDTDSDVPRADALPALEAVLEALQAAPGVAYLIEGHTDSQGSAEHNDELSRRRAQAIVDWLVEQGVDRALLRAEGYGAARPVADNSTGTGRALNRRVEVVVDG